MTVAGGSGAARTAIAGRHTLAAYGCPDSKSGIDFLMEWAPYAGAIVTNPPSELATEFVTHAIALCPRVIMLLRLAARDAGILVSLCLQHGCSVETIARALSRNADGSASGVVSAVLDKINRR
jgi:hypothetical protein